MPNQREWLEEFVEIYHSEPCLWKGKSKEYHDSVKRDAAYEKLLAKLQETEPTSNKESVFKKVNNLRCAYKKEHKKVMGSKSGSSAEDIYEPNLWYYSLMRFLDDQDIPRQSRSNLDDEDNSLESASSAVVESEMQETESGEASSASAEFIPITTATLGATADATPPSSGSSYRKRNSEATVTKDVLISVRDHFKRPAPSPPPQNHPDDRFDIFGKAVAFKLRDLVKTQRILAEKIINETLAAAELGNLTASHTVIAPFSNSPFDQSLSNQSYSSRSIHNTSPYSYQQSPPIQSPVYEQRTNSTIINRLTPSSPVGGSLYNQSKTQSSPVIVLSIPENL